MTVARKSYAEKLRDPKWQRKRLEIMQRDDFRCLACGGAATTLHVHHGYYEKGRDPWDYPNETLHTLCKDCHGEAEELRRAIQKAVGARTVGDLERLLGYLEGDEFGWIGHSIERWYDTRSGAWIIGFVAGADGAGPRLTGSFDSDVGVIQRLSETSEHPGFVFSRLLAEPPKKRVG